MLELRPAPRRNLIDEATDQISHAIVSGRLRPGQRINEVEIAAALGISRAPLREALVTLASRGLVSKHPNRGAFVNRFSRKDAAEVFGLRTVLERYAVSLLVEWPGTQPLAVPWEIAREMRGAIAEEPSAWDVSALDIRFHAALVAAAGNDRLMYAWDNLRAQIHLLLYTRNVMNENYRTAIVEGHVDLLSAIADRDRPRALRMIQDHLNAAFDLLQEAFDAEAEADADEADETVEQ